MPEFDPAMRYGIRAIRITPYIYQGWNRRRRDGWLEPIRGRQLLKHRVLWGFSRLVYVP